MRNNPRLLIFTLCIALCAAVVLEPSDTEAQSSAAEAFISWSASTYAPAGYAGKRLPTAGAMVTVGVDVLRGGRLISLAGEEVYWYLDDELFASGVGVGRASFRAQGGAGGLAEVRVEVPGLAVIKTLSVRFSSPFAIIRSPLPRGEFRGGEVVFGSEAYFFNVTDPARLVREWLVNGTPPATSEKPDALTVRVAPGTADGYPINVSLRIRNPLKTFESAARSLDLVYRP